MRNYILDMSQASVNRTAMYTITHDTRQILGDRCVGFQYFGKLFSNHPSQDVVSRLNAEGIGRLLSHPNELADEPRARTGRDADVPRLFLDPIYTLYDELRSEDHVMVLDLSTVTTPAWHNPSVARGYRRAFAKINMVRPTILSISQNSADTLMANYGYPRELIHVLPLYVPGHLLDTSPRRADDPAPRDPYILFVGSLEARKNLIGAIRSFAASGLAEQGYRLVIAGGSGHGSDQIRKAAEQAANVFLLGFVADADLAALYAEATAFIYPSYLEGFGVPLLEAMQYGIPAVASNTGACPEVGGPLIPYFDPDDHDGFAVAIRRLVALSPAARADYARKARAWIAERYTIARYGEALLSALKAGPASATGEK